MKITFVVPYSQLSGGNRVIVIYVTGLLNRGHDLFVVSPAPPQLSLKSKIKSFLTGKGWPNDEPLKYSYFAQADIPYRMLDQRQSVTDADVPDADVVIATWWETAEWVAQLSLSKGAKAYFIQHQETFNYLPINRVAATYRSPLHKIVVAEWLVELMKTQYEDREVSLVPNSVDTEQFQAPFRERQVTPTIGTIYSPVYWKGCDIGLKAFALARQQIPNLRLVAFGFHEPVPHLPLPEGTDYFCNPPQTALKEIYAQCDAWLFSSRSEGFGLPILEAMACRTPVIGTPVGAAPELLADGAGILVSPEAPEAMAEAIQQVCQLSNAQWHNMSETAYRKAISYSWEDATERFEAALKTAIKRWQRGDFTN